MSKIKSNYSDTSYLRLSINPCPHELTQPILEGSNAARCISLCNINIRSIRTKMESLETFLNDFDILVVSYYRNAP